MKLNKIFLLAGVALMGLFAASCDDDYEYSAGKAAGEYDVNFSTADEQNVVLGMSDTEFSVTLTRSNAEGELTVPVQVLAAPSCFKIPASATFANGSANATLKIECDTTMKEFTDYQLSLAIPEKYTNPYKTNEYPRFNVTVLKEDYALWKVATVQNAFLGQNPVSINVDYSPMLDLYRFNAFCGVAGYNLYLKWDGTTACEKFYVTDSNGENIDGEKFLSGASYYSYGMMSAAWYSGDDYNGYFEDESGSYYALDLKWTVSAGTVGWYSYNFWFDEE